MPFQPNRTISPTFAMKHIPRIRKSRRASSTLAAVEAPRERRDFESLSFFRSFAREDYVVHVEVEGYQRGGVDLGMGSVGKGDIGGLRGGYRSHGDMI